MQQLTAISVEDHMKARELLLAMARLSEAGHVTIADAVFVDRPADGGKVRVQQTLDMTTGGGALQGGFWGLLIGTLVAGPLGLVVGAASAAGGALIGKLVDAGVDESFVNEVKEMVEPGRTAVILLTDHLDQPAFRAEMERFQGARLLHSDLPPVARTWLEQALGQEGHHAVEVQPYAGPADEATQSL